MLVSALKSAVDAESITMRLGKRGASPHLAFSILADVVRRKNAPSDTDILFSPASFMPLPDYTSFLTPS